MPDQWAPNVQPCKYTYIFSQPPYGWTESFYRNESPAVGMTTPDAALQSGPVFALAQARLALSPPSVTLVAVRLSDPRQRSLTRLVSISGAGQGGGASSSNGTWNIRQLVTIRNTPTSTTTAMLDQIGAAETEAALLVRMEAGAHAHREFLMRGLPENIIGGNTYEDLAPGWRSRLNDLILLLTGRLQAGALGPVPGFALKTVDQSQPEVQITSIQVNTIDPRYIQVTLAGPLVRADGTQVAIGDQVLIRGVRGAEGVNGKWRIASTTTPPPWVYILGPRRGLAAFTMPPTGWGASGRVKYLAYTLTNIDVVRDFRLSTRESGRPFGLPRGRRRIRA